MVLLACTLPLRAERLEISIDGIQAMPLLRRLKRRIAVDQPRRCALTKAVPDWLSAGTTIKPGEGYSTSPVYGPRLLRHLRQVMVARQRWSSALMTELAAEARR